MDNLKASGRKPRESLPNCPKLQLNDGATFIFEAWYLGFVWRLRFGVWDVDNVLPLILSSPSLSPICYEYCDPLQAFPDDGAGVFYLGLLAAFNLRLPSKPRVYASSTIMDSQCFPHLRGHRHVF